MITAIGRGSDISAEAPFTVQTDWPHFRFDQDHTGVDPFENVLHPGNVPDLSLVWEAQLDQPFSPRLAPWWTVSSTSARRRPPPTTDG